jgi:hypothetical protein
MFVAAARTCGCIYAVLMYTFCMYVCMYIYTTTIHLEGFQGFICIHAYVHVYIPNICMYVCMYIFMYMTRDTNQGVSYIFAFTYPTHKHTHTHIHTHTLQRYELKGSMLERAATPKERENPNIVLKNVDLIVENRRFELGIRRRKVLMKQV